MLQDLIKDLQSSLKNYSQGLAKQNLLVDVPWTMVDGDLKLQRLIFNKDNSLYIIKGGDVQHSTWKYIPSMNSLMVKVGERSLLLNEVFADGKALILKKDGTSMDFLSFANQNELPNLNLAGYLKSLVEIGDLSSITNGDSDDTKLGYLNAFFAILVILIIFLIIYLS